mmetsp:Transcript_36001/g.116265  ORF Transcript_36001/g.116265 Transcript_36001/m.116265 type:complete len:289 (-) Transcript_36001:160-1026(-)
MAAFLLPALGFIAGRGCQRFGLPHATRSGPWCAADASSPQAALLSKMQAMLESGATESALLALLEKEQVGPAECGALLADIARLREEGSLPDAGDGELGDIDLSFGVEEEEEAEEGVIDLEPAAVAPTPTRGEQPWGRWENGERCASVSLYLDDAVKGRDVCCEVVEGWLLIRIDESREVLYEDGVWGGEEVIDAGDGGPPLLFGRLAQPVVAGDLEWVIEEEEREGEEERGRGAARRVLTVEMPKAAASGAASADCIFDETLVVGGVPCLAPGLSQGVLTVQLPRPC